MASVENLDGHHSTGSFPADPMHQFEIARYVDINIGTLIANCVSEDRYFDVINVLLKTQKKWMQNGYQGLLSIAKNFGLSISQVETCLSDEKQILS